jgi:acetyl-CoA carboxylase biotin carboxyl carrier protein
METRMQAVPVAAAAPAAPAAGAPAPAAPAPEPPAPPAAAAPKENVHTIKAPMVGTFYRSPSPDAEAYVDVGSRVSPENVVCILEAMKVMNEIKAECAGTIAKVCVQNGEAVEYDQPLFLVKPD